MSHLVQRRLGLETDLLVKPASMLVRRHSDALVVLRTPGRDDFWFGNVLILPAAPAPQTLGSLLERWRDEFAHAPGVSKTVLLWEAAHDASRADEPALESAATEHALAFECNLVLRLARRPAQPAQARVPMAARPVESDEDWAAVLQVATPRDAPPGQRAFIEWRQAEYRRLVQAGSGHWWLGEVDGEIVSSAGIFWDEGGRVARFQRVDTAEHARGQGCCTALISAMVVDTCRRLPRLQDCVIVAERGTQAERIYRRVGFDSYSRQNAIWGDRV